ncbi:RCC1 domain-containing protein [Comamonas thiooxydans]|uniref:RCC1 domain-containing protein n=1 Tax=Comamonas thiooxydans TaxID=363952 RepID=UPI0015542A5B|nr:biotin transporter BioY [Comamonas thiooxydans]
MAYRESLSSSLIVTGDPAFDPALARWSLGTGKLPPGLSLGTGGVISGTPTAITSEAGTSFEVVASYKTKAAQQAYMIQVGDDYLEVTQISAGAQHTCAVLTSGGVACWGSNTYSQLGTGTSNDSIVPVTLPGLSGIVNVSAGSVHTCAVSNSGALYCWGYNGQGQAGQDKSIVTIPTPMAVDGSGFKSVDLGSRHSCALKLNGELYCWGQGSLGSLGTGFRTSFTTPTLVAGPVSTVTAFSTGEYHTCAISGGALYCWGFNASGQLGAAEGNTSNLLTPMRVSGLDSGVTDVATGSNHTCAVHNGEAKCWGAGGNGRLGDGTVTTRHVPAAGVTGLGNGVTKVSAGSAFSCAVKNGEVWCWGENSAGQLAQGSTSAGSLVPVRAAQVGSSEVTDITLGDIFACVRQAGLAKCWGGNEAGQLGNGTTETRSLPVGVQPIQD